MTESLVIFQIVCLEVTPALQQIFREIQKTCHELNYSNYEVHIVAVKGNSGCYQEVEVFIAPPEIPRNRLRVMQWMVEQRRLRHLNTNDVWIFHVDNTKPFDLKYLKDAMTQISHDETGQSTIEAHNASNTLVRADVEDKIGWLNPIIEKKEKFTKLTRRQGIVVLLLSWIAAGFSFATVDFVTQIHSLRAHFGLWFPPLDTITFTLMIGAGVWMVITFVLINAVTGEN